MTTEPTDAETSAEDGGAVVPDGGEPESESGSENGDEAGEETHELTVAVENADREPVEGATVTVERSEVGLVEGMLAESRRQTTGSDGETSVQVEDGIHTVIAEADDGSAEDQVVIDGADERVTLAVGTEEEGEAKDQENEEEDGPKEAEGNVADEETEGHGTDRGTTILYLDLEGLFLDVLGLEVDLHEVVLDLRAIPGSGNLLGNLLAAVAGLLDGGSLSTLLNRLLNTVSNIANALTSPIGSLKDVAGRVRDALASLLSVPIERLRDAVEDLKAIPGRIISALAAPIERLRGKLNDAEASLPEPGIDGNGNGGEDEDENGDEDETEEHGGEGRLDRLGDGIMSGLNSAINGTATSLGDEDTLNRVLAPLINRVLGEPEDDSDGAESGASN